MTKTRIQTIIDVLVKENANAECSLGDLAGSIDYALQKLKINKSLPDKQEGTK